MFSEQIITSYHRIQQLKCLAILYNLLATTFIQGYIAILLIYQKSIVIQM